MSKIHRPVDNKKLEELYNKYITLANDAEKKQDSVLAERYYQHAEHYLHVLNKASKSKATTHHSRKMPLPAFKSSMQDPNGVSPPMEQEPPKEGKLLPFKAPGKEMKEDEVKEVPESKPEE